ncbi:MAG: TatD family hydrolase [Polyangiaceae bacterium]|nr:TatD family hydrolase [Polyangiaceae bacterium]
MLVDTHCHLDRGVYPEGPEEPLARARAAGVGAFVSIGVDATLDAARDAIAIAARTDDVWATVGLHPHDAKVWTDEMSAEIERLAVSPKVVAVGEIGLDYHYMSSPKEQQLEVFRRMIALARRVKRTIVIHTREAPADTLDVLEAEGASEVGGIIHCFSEDLPFARRALDLGFDLSFSGIVTFKNAKSIHEVAAWAPLDRILVETDSPYLAPVPFRGKPCEPAMVVHTAKRVAELRSMPLDELTRATSDNARKRLGITL